MKRKFLLVTAVLAIAFAFSSCQVDETINTTNMDGSWFVSKIEMLKNVGSIDDEIYETANVRNYDMDNLANGSLLVKIEESETFNLYAVHLYKYDGQKWNSLHGQQVRLSSNNHFEFYGRSCKLKKGGSGVIEVKVKEGELYYRYRLEKVWTSI